MSAPGSSFRQARPKLFPVRETSPIFVTTQQPLTTTFPACFLFYFQLQDDSSLSCHFLSPIISRRRQHVQLLIHLDIGLGIKLRSKSSCISLARRDIILPSS